MEYSRKDIEELAKKSCFLKDNLEKVLRLSDLLDLIFSSPIGENLALKGGTAINFAYFNLPRLSIDIDLDYIQLSREKMMKDRGIIKKSLREMVEIEGYSISDKSKEHFALDSYVLNFINNAGNRDNIKVEINYLNRVHLYEKQKIRIKTPLFESNTDIRIVNKYDLFGSKISALINRAKPRDLYDINKMIENDMNMDVEELKKSAIFYALLGGARNFNEDTFSIIDEITEKEINRMLKPLLKKNDRFNYIDAKNKSKDFLNRLFVLSEREEEFIYNFEKGSYSPELLITKNMNPDIVFHPMAQWKIIHIQKAFENGDESVELE
ncbi:MAG: nucleotidyl transferase AbiEii/AbiGii toxin family protein [Candidatus Moranbacteria bacterium]|nr:nucleotidyl transferase AbiEii/AbiGii toxin family protein [Candidatus Moranbacteria bacterium]